MKLDEMLARLPVADVELDFARSTTNVDWVQVSVVRFDLGSPDSGHLFLRGRFGSSGSWLALLTDGGATGQPGIATISPRRPLTASFFRPEDVATDALARAPKPPRRELRLISPTFGLWNADGTFRITDSVD